MSERQATMNALFAVKDVGGKLLVAPKFADSLKDYTGNVMNAMVTDHKEACRIGAYVIDRPFYGDNRHGWRLCKLMTGGGHDDITPMFPTASAFNDAMRTVSAMVGMKP